MKKNNQIFVLDFVNTYQTPNPTGGVTGLFREVALETLGISAPGDFMRRDFRTESAHMMIYV